MYFLSKDCYVCNAQGYWIILNVSRDQYLCVTDADLTSIGAWIFGRQSRDEVLGKPQHLDPARESLIGSLLAKGVLTVNSDRGKAFVESENSASMTAAVCPEPLIPPISTLFCAAHFFWACAKIDWCLRHRKLALQLVKLERRKLRAGSCTGVLEDPGAKKLIAAFKHLRPFYPRPYLCLFDSLALLEFLAGYHSYPRIVFGVVADPFQAHCWLQEGDVLLNDDLEQVGKYTPIMSV
jgi:Transglutaminase-like superfamily